ncbi:hypothetical protein [Synechococcus phage Ssp-JY38]|nr:hypothetical protein [Synechococcus phage Yong-L2-223]
MTNVSHTRIAAQTHTGAGNGNTYRFEVATAYGYTVLSACERDVAEHYTRNGQTVPADVAGPYDGYGHPLV